MDSVLRRHRARGPAGRPAFHNEHRTGANRAALKEILEAAFQTFTVDELGQRLQAKSVPFGRVRSMREAIAHPQVAARDIVLKQQRPDIGAVETLAPVVPRGRLRRSAAPPALGEHTEEILKGLGAR